MPRAPNARLRVAVGIATVGRPQLVRQVVDQLGSQTRLADSVLVAACDPADVMGVTGEQVACIFSGRGLTRQRNAILKKASSVFDVLVFFDDDFLPHPTYIETVERIFATQADVAMVTGLVVADGIIGPGLGVEEARLQLLTSGEMDPDGSTLKDVYNGYGCNMAVRIQAVQRGHIEFDERLPLYGWLEDVDFSRRLARWGRIVRSKAARGVHLGAKSGRQSGIRLGYSQIANPVYLVRKGTFARSRAVWQIGRNVAMNLIFSIAPEAYIDRRGRLKGNMRAIGDLAFRRLHPERILSMR